MTAEQVYQWVLVLIPYVFPLLTAGCAVLYKRVIANLPQNRQELIHKVVTTAVQAVEQSVNAAPQDKKLAALDLASQVLREMGVKKASTTVLSTMIEQVVYAINQAKPLTPPKRVTIK